MWLTLYHEPQGMIDFVPQPPKTYGRWWANGAASTMFDTRKDWLTGYGLDNNARILVVGCAYGFLIEYLLDAGIEDVWGIDPSPAIWDPANDGEWRADVKPRVANDWIGSGTEQASLQALPGVTGRAKFTWIVVEDADTSHSDAEMPTFIAALEDRLQGNVKGRIIHIVTPIRDGIPGDSSQNWKTMAEWEAFAPDHRWVNATDGTVQ